MRRYIYVLMPILALILFLTGCGTHDSNSIVSDLSGRSEDLESYQGHGKMQIKTGHDTQEYEIEIWYKKPNFYRVALKNVKKNILQILLRNDKGVYVLTPHLKKSFRFQSDWPTSSRQVYLYQTIMSSIIDDQARKFQAGKEEYQFEVAAKYSFNPHLKVQKIWLDEDLYPKRVVVFNDQQQEVVRMDFDRFTEGVSFEDDAFDMQKNLNNIPKQDKPTMASKQTEVAAQTPHYIPRGARLMDEQVIQSADGPVVIMRFKGKPSFTLLQRKPRVEDVSIFTDGTPVQLFSGTLGVLTGHQQRNRLVWVQGATEFELMGALGMEEMVKIANSVSDQETK